MQNYFGRHHDQSWQILVLAVTLLIGPPKVYLLSPPSEPTFLYLRNSSGLFSKLFAEYLEKAGQALEKRRCGGGGQQCSERGERAVFSHWPPLQGKGRRRLRISQLCKYIPDALCCQSARKLCALPRKSYKNRQSAK